MNSETYITVIVGIIVGMTLARLVSFIGQLLKFRNQTGLFWIQLSWVIGMILFITQGWWAMHTDWDFSNIQSLLTFSILLIVPVVQYLISVILCPELAANSKFSIREHYNENRSTFYVLLGILFFGLIPESILMTSSSEGQLVPNLVRSLVGVFFICCAFLVRRVELIDRILPFVVVLILFLYTALCEPLNESPRSTEENKSEQVGDDQPATAPESKSEGNSESQPESEGRPQ